MRVERVTVHEGGQAIVGSIVHQGGGMAPKTRDQPHEPQRITHAPGVPVLSQIEAEREAVPIASGPGLQRLPHAWRSWRARAGNRNAFKHGLYTAKAIETRRVVAKLTKQARELVGGV